MVKKTDKLKNFEKDFEELERLVAQGLECFRECLGSKVDQRSSSSPSQVLEFVPVGYL